MSAAGRGVLWTACASHGLIHVYELSVPALFMPIQREFQAGDSRMGFVIGIYSLLFGLGALPAGWLVDRLGSKVPLCICLWGGSIGMIGMALSPSLISFTVSAALMGLALSIYHPAGTAWISHAMPRSGRIFASHGMAGNLGVAAAAAVAGGLGAWLGWRTAIGLLAVPGLVLGFHVAALDAPPPGELRARAGRGDRRSFALLLVAVAFMGMVYRGTTTFLPKYLATIADGGTAVSTAVGGLLTTSALMVGLVGMWAAGRASDRGVAAPRVFLVGALAQIPFLLALSAVGGGWLLPAAMGVAFFHFLTQPPGNLMVSDFTPPRLRGLGYGLFFFLSFGVGSIGAVLGGWVSDRAGLSATFSAFALLLVPTIVAVSWLSRSSHPQA